MAAPGAATRPIVCMGRRDLTPGDDGWLGIVSVLSMISVANLHRAHGIRRAIVTASGLMSQA